MEQILVVILAVLLDLLLGELPNRFHPVVWIGKWIQFSASKLKNKEKMNSGIAFSGGALLTLIGIALFSLPFFFLSKALANLPFFIRVLVTALLLKPAFALKALHSAANQVDAALSIGDLAEARRLTAWHLVSRDTSQLDEPHIVSAVVESASENFCDSFVAPLLAFWVGGLPFVWAYRYVNTADAMIGYRTLQWEYFGKFAAISDDILNWIPARISGLFLCLAAPFAGGNLQKGIRILIQDHARTASPNSGWPMAAMAGVFDIQLEKNGSYLLNSQGKMPKREIIQKSNRLILVAAVISLIGGGLFTAVLG